MTATSVPSLTVPRATAPEATATTASASGSTTPKTPATPTTSKTPKTALLTTPPTHHVSVPAPRPATVDWSELASAVQESGQYPTREEAENVTRIVLSALGGHVVGDERVDLARALPEEAARVVADQVPATRPLTAAQFVDQVAARIEGATPATARWDVSSVLGTLPKLVGDDLVDRVLAQLPPGYALLFGKAELAPVD